MKNIETATAYQNLSSISTNGLSVPKLKILMDVRKDLLKKNEDYNGLRIEIFKSYDIIVVPNSDNEEADKKYESHPDKKEISDKIIALDNEEAIIEGSNFLTEDEFYRCVLGKSPNEIDLLAELLLIKETI